MGRDDMPDGYLGSWPEGEGLNPRFEGPDDSPEATEEVRRDQMSYFEADGRTMSEQTWTSLVDHLYFGHDIKLQEVLQDAVNPELFDGFGWNTTFGELLAETHEEAHHPH